MASQEQINAVLAAIDAGTVELAEFRGLYPAPGLTNEQLVHVIADRGAQDTTSDEWVVLMQTAEAALARAAAGSNAPITLPDTRSADTTRLQPIGGTSAIANRMYELAAIADQDEELNAEAKRNIVAREVTIRGPFNAYLHLVRALGTDHLKTVPTVGLPERDEDGNENDNPDIYFTQAPKVNGGLKKIRHSAIYDFCDGFHIGADLKTKLEVFEGEPTKTPGNPWFGMSPVDMKKAKQVLTTQQTTFRKLIRQGIELFQVISKLQDLERDGRVMLDMDTTKNEQGHLVSAAVNAPFTIWGMKDRGDGKLVQDAKAWQSFSAGQLVTLDIDAAIEKDGGTYLSIMSTLERDAKTPTVSAGEQPIKNELEFVGRMAELAAYLAGPEAVAHRLAITKMLTAKKFDPHLYLSIGDAFAELDSITSKIPNFENIYNDECAKRLAKTGKVSGGAAAAPGMGTANITTQVQGTAPKAA